MLVARAIEVLGLGPTVVVGHSLGGYVSLQAAIQGAPDIRGLVLVAPAGFGDIQNSFLRMLAVPGAGDLAIKSGRLGLPILLRSLVHDPRIG